MAFQLFFAFSDKDFSAKDQAVRQLSPDSNTSPQPKRVRTRGGNTSARRRGRGFFTRGGSSCCENLTTIDAPSTSSSWSLPPSTSLPLQAVSYPSHEANNDNDAATVLVHKKVPLSPKTEKPSPN